MSNPFADKLLLGQRAYHGPGRRHAKVQHHTFKYGMPESGALFAGRGFQPDRIHLLKDWSANDINGAALALG